MDMDTIRAVHQDIRLTTVAIMAGYSAGWNNNGNVRTVSSQSEGAAIGGNKVNGDNNIINQQIVQSQRHHSDNNANNENNDHNDGGDNSGQLPKCKAFCLGVQ